MGKNTLSKVALRSISLPFYVYFKWMQLSP